MTFKEFFDQETAAASDLMDKATIYSLIAVALVAALVIVCLG